MAYSKPDYPAVLTKGNWDKNKGVLAKLAGYTGMGEALSKLEKTYKAVNWDKLEVHKNRPNQKEFTLKKLEALVAGAVAEMKGPAAKLRAECFAVRDLAKKTEAQYKANKAVPKSASDLCDHIAKSADFIGVGVNANSLGTYIEKDAEEVRKAYDFTFNAVKTKIPPTIKALENAVKAVIAKPTHAEWTKQAMMTRCRDLNQYIGNVSKLIAMGYDLHMDAGTCDKFFKDMEKYAAKDAPFADSASAEEVKKHLAVIVGLIARAKKIK